tara:strand:- start:402 stop:533 length:132 start_codon:yes stop_codon:yes gene_type:complete
MYLKKIKIPLIQILAGKRIYLLGKKMNGRLKTPIKIVHDAKAQ